jgi:hypothetical protein
VEGRDLTAVMGTLGVDGARTTTNHVMETEKVLFWHWPPCHADRECLLLHWIPSGPLHGPLKCATTNHVIETEKGPPSSLGPPLAHCVMTH